MTSAAALLAQKTDDASARDEMAAILRRKDVRSTVVTFLFLKRSATPFTRRPRPLEALFSTRFQLATLRRRWMRALSQTPPSHASDARACARRSAPNDRSRGYTFPKGKSRACLRSTLPPFTSAPAP